MMDSNTPTDAPRADGPSTVAYTRGAVDEYLHAVWLRRQELEVEITAARGRTARAALAASRLDALERAVGASLVAAYARHVAALRREGKPLTSLPRPPVAPASPVAPVTAVDAILDLTTIENDPAPHASASTVPPDEYGDFHAFSTDRYSSSTDGYSSLRGDVHDGFGDEFFGPLTQSHVTNGNEAVRNG
jgi:hypothetical protein